MVNERRRACDACRSRKVKCNGELKCQQCNHLGLRCSYNAIRAVRGPVGRGKRLQQWQHDRSASVLPLAPSLPECETSSENSSAFYSSFLSDYESYVYPFHPIISTPDVRKAIIEMPINQEARAFIYALVAITITLTRSGSVHEDVTSWIEASIELQQAMLSTGEMTVRRILTCQWQHVVLMDTRRTNLAYFYLQQSIAMLEIMRMDENEAMLDTAERAQRQRLYYLIFIHERFMALQHGKRLTLPHFPQLSIMDLSIPASIHHGFQQIYRLFAHVDTDLLSKLHNGVANSHLITPDWIEGKHNAINDEIISTYDEDMGLSDFQLADLIITKHWLHMLLWQIAVSQCLLTSSPSGTDERFMSLLFPIRISSHLISTLKDRPEKMFTVHGTAMHKKLFEITDTIGNVLVTVPAAASKARTGRIADFLFLLHFLSSLPNLDVKQREVLDEKLVQLQSMYPDDEAWTTSPSRHVESAHTDGHIVVHQETMKIA